MNKKRLTVIASVVGCFLLIIAACVFVWFNDSKATSANNDNEISEESKPNDKDNEVDENAKDSDLEIETKGNGNKRIISYFPNWGIYGEAHQQMTVGEMPWDRITHINHAFFTVNSSFKLETTDSFADFEKSFEHSGGWDSADSLRGHIGEYKYYKSIYPDVKVLISVGGWTRSENFHAMAKDKASRKIFIDSVIDFLKKYPFIDGIDLDWEYPGIDRKKDPNDEYDRGAPGGPEDTKNYGLLLKEIRQAYKDNNMEDKLLTIAAPAGYDKADFLEAKEYAKYLDFLNIMTYDMHGAWETTTNHHSPLYAKKDDPSGTSPVDIKNKYNVDAAMKYYSDKLGVEPEKLNMGTPFYSRGWGGVKADSAKDALYANATGKYVGSWDNAQSPGGQMPWFKLRDMENKNGFEKYYDEKAEAPYLYNKSEGIFLTYEDERSLKAKCEYVIDNKYGGMILWEITGDSKKDNFPMIDIMHKVFGNKANSKATGSSETTSNNNNSNNNSNNEGTTSSSAPGKAQLTNTNPDNQGCFEVTMNLWWGENGEECVLYENGKEIGRQKLTANGTQAQKATFDVLARKKGDYTYYCELINKSGKTKSDELKVSIN